MSPETLKALREQGMLLDPKYDLLTNAYKVHSEKIEEKEKNEKKNINEIADTGANIVDDETKREIYLTFDDGLEAGTEEILELLKEKKVRGTFFLIGKRIESMHKRNKDKCYKLMNDIYENHAIGNHSYSHANEFYSAYYREGGVIIKVENGKKIRRSVVNDFAKAKNTILYYLELAKGKSNPPTQGYSNSKLVAKNQKKILARFPGSNTWYIRNRIIDIKATTRGEYSIPVKDTENEAKDLGKDYNIFGWDCEWRRSEPTTNELIRKAIEDKINNNTIRYDNTDDTDPFFDLYSKEYINHDRLIESVEEVKNELLDKVYLAKIQPFDDTAKSSGKVILLMHDRQFRKGKLNKLGEVDKKDKSELQKLADLIDYFKSIKAEFKTLDEY